ncbi:type II secretion system protein [bacterium]|nr:type II secretion system protein [bacterium]
MKKGFTLAEVLITLGVIGVVAALTMPTLIDRYNKKVWVNQLKKSYSIVEQGFQKMMADEEVFDLSNVSVFSALSSNKNVSCSASYTENGEICQPILQHVKKYFKGEYGVLGHDIYTFDKSEKLVSKDRGIYQLPDGTQIDFYFSDFASPNDCKTIKENGGHICKRLGFSMIDINGKKGPNLIGRDVFYFTIGEDGKLYPSNGIDDALICDIPQINGNIFYWRNIDYYCGKPNMLIHHNAKNDLGFLGVSGEGCAARIMENGWVMDY